MGFLDFFKKKDSSENAEELNEFTKQISEQAFLFKENYEKKFSGLDFSINSLIIVDQMLNEVYYFYNDMDENHKQNIISTTGSYIFEVARKNFGGKYFWYDKLNQPILVTGQPDFEMSLLAFEKVKGRLENGIEDNIPFFFEGFIEGVKNKKSAMIV